MVKIIDNIKGEIIVMPNSSVYDGVRIAGEKVVEHKGKATYKIEGETITIERSENNG